MEKKYLEMSNFNNSRDMEHINRGPAHGIYVFTCNLE